MAMSATECAEPAPARPARRRIAPLPRRLAAAFIDIGLVSAVALTVALVRVDVTLSGSMAEMLAMALELTATASVVAIVVGIAHEVVGIAVWGRTVGKLLCGLMVRHADRDGPVGWYRAAMRAGVPFVSGLAPMVGHVAPFLIYGWLVRDDDHQGLHDKAAHTVVVCAGPHGGGAAA